MGFGSRLGYLSDFQCVMQNSLVQMYQGECYKRLVVRRLGGTQKGSLPRKSAGFTLLRLGIPV